MGKRGPQPTDTATLEARGSWRAAARQKAEKAAEPRPPRLAASWSDLGEAELHALIRGLPGYDPFTLAEGYRFDCDLANRALRFFAENLNHIEGAMAGKPFILERWQQAFVANLFGWVRWSEKWGRWVRRVRESLLYVPRKNGKTPLIAGVGLYVLLLDAEQGQQDYLAAATREQAGKLFRYAKGMVAANPRLSGLCHVYGGTAAGGMSKSIVKLPEETSSLQVIAADANAQHGGTSHLIIIEELHAQPNRDLVDTLSTSLASENRAEPLMLHVTTADFQRESICNEKYLYACKVRDGAIPDPAFLPVVYEALPTDDWTAEATWEKANPNLDVSVSRQYLRSEVQKAQQNPSLENIFKRLHLNLRTQTDVRWLSLDLWDKGGEPFDVETLRNRDCYGGLDFGWRDDYAALSLVFPPEHEGGIWHSLFRFWLPEECARDKRQEPTRTFIDLGLVELTDGNSTDIEAIYEALRSARAIYNVRKVLLDPANARKQGQDLQNDGFEVEEFIQSKRSYTAACCLLESLLRDGLLRHGGNKVARWMAGNAAVEENGLGQKMPKKKRSAEKIDGLCALCMGIGGAMLRQDASPSLTVF